MRVISMVYLLLVAILMCDNAFASGTLEVSGGVALPTKNLDDFYSSGYSFAAGYLFDVSSHLGIGLNAAYARVALDKSAVSRAIGPAEDAEAEGGDWSAKTLCVEIRLKTGLTGGTSIWGAVGGGLFRIGSETRTEYAQGEVFQYTYPSQNRLGGYLGVGLDAAVSPQVGLGVELKAHLVSVDDDPRYDLIEGDRSFAAIRAVVQIRP